MESRRNQADKGKKQWSSKNDNVAFISHVSLIEPDREGWYFDNGCSRHMTGVKKFLMNIESHTTSHVTFGDGSRSVIKGVGKLIGSGLPSLTNVLYVKGLTVNLISISQLCDQGLKVNYTKSECLVLNDKNEIIMKRGRTKNNCYMWIPLGTECSSTSLI